MQYVIIGCSAAGINAIETIRTRDKKDNIAVISDEKNPLYSRCLISYLLAGTIDKGKLWYRTDSFFRENEVQPHLGIKAQNIDTDKKKVHLEDGTKIKFDRLLIATGASAKLENIPGVDKKGVYPLRTIDDALNIDAMLDKVKNVAVLGGGLIGLRAGYALKNRGKDVSIFVRSPHILSQIADKDSALIIQRIIEEKGIKIRTNRSAKEIIGKGAVEGIILDDGAEYNCELVIIGKGVSPNIGIAKKIGLKTDWGIVTDQFLRTSNKDIFSAGDVAESYDIALQEQTVNAIWPAACEQGRIAGLNMLGENQQYDGTLAMNSLEFFGVPIISIGITRPKKDIYKQIIKKATPKNIYKKIVLRDGIIVGAVLVNNVNTIGIIGCLIRNKVDVRDIEDIILEDYSDYGKISTLIKDSKKESFRAKEFKETVMTL